MYTGRVFLDVINGLFTSYILVILLCDFVIFISRHFYAILFGLMYV